MLHMLPLINTTPEREKKKKPSLIYRLIDSNAAET